MRILVIKPSSLGDVIHALPTVNLIRRQFPEAHIAWLLNENLASLLTRSPVIDELVRFRRQHFATPRGLLDIADFLATLQGKQFDVVVDLQCLLRSGVMTGATLASRRIGLSDAREGARLFYNEIVSVSRVHAVDRYLLAARHLGCPDWPIEFPLGLSHNTGHRSLIAVNPCARWESKLWGDHNFSELLDHLPSDRVVLIGSSDERERIAQINHDRARNLAGELDLYELATLYGQCAVVISNDTGTMHLAAAVGAPVVALFGPTDPALVGPYGRGHTVIRSPTGDVRDIKLDQVLAAAKPFLV
jgi:lipopolysaccharide heptosyltransferase I